MSNARYGNRPGPGPRKITGFAAKNKLLDTCKAQALVSTNMKPVSLVLALLLGALGSAAAQTPAAAPSLQQMLRVHRWKKRLLLVAAPSAEQAGFRRQKELLAAAPAALQARDILVLDVLYDRLNPADLQYLQQQTGLRPPAFGVALIGKDGGVKRTSPQPLAPADLFGTVDQMPMRRQEMKRRP